FDGIILWAGYVRGPAAPPGQYSVRLTATGPFDGAHGIVTKAQPFAIVRNPKIAATDADLREKFTLASQISEKGGAANGAALRIRDVKAQIADGVSKTNDAKIAAAADALTTLLTNVEGEIYQYRNRSSQDPLNFPIKLNNKLAALQSIVEYGDNKPTDQSYA